MAQLLSSFGRRGANLGLDHIAVDLEDIKQLSKYFDVTEFNPVFTAGKNSVSFNGSSYLAPNSEIRIECLDNEGNSLFVETPPFSANYKDMGKFTISVSVFADTVNGPGLFILVGTLFDGRTVRWKANITINNGLQNTSRVRFYNAPTLEVRPLLYPVIQSTTGSALTTDVILSGKCYGDYSNQYYIGAAQQTPSKPTPDVLWIHSSDQNTKYNSQMIGYTIVLYITAVKTSLSQNIISGLNLTQSFKINHVYAGGSIVTLDDVFYYPDPMLKRPVVSAIPGATFEIRNIQTTYNTSSNAYQTTPDGSLMKRSYAEIIYRNIKTFSGIVARQKLYAKSNVYPGDFELVSDTAISPYEFLTDPLNASKKFSSIGSFSSQYQINQNWFTSSKAFSLIQTSSYFIDTMYINASNYSASDDKNYVIAKVTSPNSQSNSTYYPYVKTDFDSLNGDGYTSNFIDLKKDTTYVLSTNLTVQKNLNTADAKVSFYFTSSDSNITSEKNYHTNRGLLLGQIPVSERTEWKLFSDIQSMFFTTNNDYFGTLVIVPYKCNVLLADLTIQNYGDYGFSPDTGYLRIPFPVNVANEAFTIKAELYDINSNLIYSNLETVEVFDRYGESLYGSTILGSTSGGNPSVLPVLTIDGDLYLPNVSTCNITNNSRILGINLSNGAICATNIVNLSMISSPSSNTYKDYIQLDTVSPTLTGRSLIVHYNGLTSEGKRIVILANGSKTIYS